MSELAVMIEDTLEAMRHARRKPAPVIPPEIPDGNVIDRMVRAAMPSVILAGRAANKRAAANERQRQADQEALNRSIIANTPHDAGGDVVSYEESDPAFV